jgi:hypothetical protein
MHSRVIQAAAVMLFGMMYAGEATPNPNFKIDPEKIFPTPESIRVHGVTYTDTVPDTLDLAGMAKAFLHGATRENVPLGNIWIPGGPGFFDPTNPGNDSKTANLDSVEGYQNWGKLALGMILAREMSGNDGETLAGEHRSLTTMLSWDTVLALQKQSRERTKHLGGMNLTYGVRFMTPASVITQALVARYRQDPGNEALRAAINEYVRMHREQMRPQAIGGATYYDFLDQATDPRHPAGLWDTFGGYNGAYSAFAFINGRGAMAMFEWFHETGNEDAYDIGAKLAAFMRSFTPLWANPDPARFTAPGPGQFEGHIHSFLQAAHAFTDEAAARLKNDPKDALAKDDIRRADDMYEFVKRITHGEVLGAYGEMDSTEDMIRLGIDLSELGAGPYWDEVERWTRNTLADRQIDAATADRYIGNLTTGTYSTDHVGEKVTGMWFSDSAHSLAIPRRAWMYNIDDATNPMHATYDVWARTAEIKDGVARINFDLNRASPYLDVKSDLPYRGQVEIAMKGNIGPVAAIAVRVPGWADRGKVTVAVRDASGEHALEAGTGWEWEDETYVRVHEVKASAAYVVRFPIKVYKRTFTDIRGPDEFWYEGSYPSPNRKAAEEPETFTGIFRGDTLVDAEPRPTAGVPRYQRQNLAALPVTDVAPPMKKVERFVFGAKY